MIKTFDIYKSPSLYDDQYWWKKDDIEFYKRLFPSRSNILELGSGTGRLAFPLIRNSIKYYGLEISKEFCEYTQKKLINKKHRDRIIQGDMRDFKIKGSFDYIFIAFNTFLHILKNEDAIRCLHCIKEHLADKGEFILDIVSPKPSFLHTDKIKSRLVMDFKDSIEEDTVEIYEKCRYSNETEICDIRWEYQYKKKPQNNKIFEYEMRMYYPDTMNRLLIDAGFDILEIYGDYELNIFNEKSPLQIYKCK